MQQDRRRGPATTGGFAMPTTARVSCSGSRDAEAARFVNDFQDIVSADPYWFTDPYSGADDGRARLASARPV